MSFHPPTNFEFGKLFDVPVNVSSQLSASDESNNPKSNNQRDGLHRANYDRGNPDFSCGFVRRLVFLILSLLAGFGLAIWGGIRFDYERPVVSGSLVLLPIVFVCGGWFLYGATLFPSTCGWWL